MEALSRKSLALASLRSTLWLVNQFHSTVTGRAGQVGRIRLWALRQAWFVGFLSWSAVSVSRSPRLPRVETDLTPWNTRTNGVNEGNRQKMKAVAIIATYDGTDCGPDSSQLSQHKGLQWRNEKLTSWSKRVKVTNGVNSQLIVPFLPPTYILIRRM